MNDLKTIEAVANLTSGNNTYFNEFHRYLKTLRAATVESLVNSPAEDMQMRQGAARMIDSILRDIESAVAKHKQVQEKTSNGSAQTTPPAG